MLRSIKSGVITGLCLGVFALAGCSKPTGGAAAGPEVKTVALAVQNGVAYVPIHVMQDQGLVEKHARRLGIELTAEYKNLGQAAFIRDALLANQIQFGVAGPPTLVTMHEKTGGDIRAVAAVVSTPMWLNTTNPKIKTICDFTEGDKIALPTIKSSVQAVALQMASKKYCGDPLRNDRFTVSMPHPDGYNALMTGAVGSHMTTPPFAIDEVAKGKGKVRTVLVASEVLGDKATLVFLLGSDKFRQANPKVYQAVRDALEEAEAFVREHPREAAQTYLKIEKPKQTLEDVLAQMTRPDVNYDTTPVALGTYASFMHEIGTVKSQYDWKALSMPDLSTRNGS